MKSLTFSSFTITNYMQNVFNRIPTKKHKRLVANWARGWVVWVFSIIFSRVLIHVYQQFYRKQSEPQDVEHIELFHYYYALLIHSPLSNVVNGICRNRTGRISWMWITVQSGFQFRNMRIDLTCSVQTRSCMIKVASIYKITKVENKNINVCYFMCNFVKSVIQREVILFLIRSFCTTYLHIHFN